MCPPMNFMIVMALIIIDSSILMFRAPCSIEPEFRVISHVHDARNKYSQRALLNPFFSLLREMFWFDEFSHALRTRSEIRSLRLCTIKIQKYGISFPNKLLKLQIDNSGTSIINFFPLMSGYFTRIKILFRDRFLKHKSLYLPWNISSKSARKSSFWKFKYL